MWNTSKYLYLFVCLYTSVVIEFICIFCFYYGVLHIVVKVFWCWIRILTSCHLFVSSEPRGECQRWEGIALTSNIWRHFIHLSAKKGLTLTALEKNFPTTFRRDTQRFFPSNIIYYRKKTPEVIHLKMTTDPQGFPPTKVNQDLKCLSNWLRTNQIALNASKTEVIIFRQRNKKIQYRKSSI